jgi:hypothetical protein
MYSCLEFGLDPLGVSVPQAFTHHLSSKVGLFSLFKRKKGKVSREEDIVFSLGELNQREG